MPTGRFNRLSDQKKKIIREAAIKEFARVPFEKASINQIIRNAEISRGSFYTYFLDKHDVLSFIFEENQKQLKNQCMKFLRENGGDYIGMLRDLFGYLAYKIRETQDMMQLVRNVSAYQNGAALFGVNHSLGEYDEQLDEVFSYADMSRTWVKNKEDKEALMMLGISALFLALSQFYQNPDEIDEIRRRLDKKLYLLQYGIYKQPGGCEPTR